MTMKNSNENIREIIKKVVSENKLNLSPEALERQEKAMIDIFENRILPGKALGFSEEFLEYVYKFAYTLYQQNKIEDAELLYSWLKSMVPTNEKYTVALLNTLVYQKKWAEAISYLVELGERHPADPYPFEKISEGFVEVKNLLGAFVAIEEAIKRAGSKKEFSKDKAKWIMNRDFILSQIKQEAIHLAEETKKKEAMNFNTVKVKESR